MRRKLRNRVLQNRIQKSVIQNVHVHVTKSRKQRKAVFTPAVTPAPPQRPTHGSGGATVVVQAPAAQSSSDLPFLMRYLAAMASTPTATTVPPAAVPGGVALGARRDPIEPRASGRGHAEPRPPDSSIASPPRASRARRDSADLRTPLPGLGDLFTHNTPPKSSIHNSPLPDSETPGTRLMQNKEEIRAWLFTNAVQIKPTKTYKTLAAQQKRVNDLNNERDLLKLYYDTKREMESRGSVEKFPEGMTPIDYAKYHRYHSELMSDFEKVSQGDFKGLLDAADDGLTGGAANQRTGTGTTTLQPVRGGGGGDNLDTVGGFDWYNDKKP